jgi:hypothetical protein
VGKDAHRVAERRGHNEIRKGGRGGRGQAAKSVFEFEGRRWLQWEQTEVKMAMSMPWLEQDPALSVFRLPRPFPFHLDPLSQFLERCGESHLVCKVFSAERRRRLAPSSSLSRCREELGVSAGAVFVGGF